ncbi:nucleosome assembly protein-domain-containing protein [Baffinella frigidus]|nr:nucleosome assembly protein-domain-containing protein [Cryptophyta sp. CCMP2293]
MAAGSPCWVSDCMVILKSLTNITSETLPEEVGVGFKLEFTFKTNEFFTNTTLTKTYLMADGDEPVLEKSEGTEIVWAEGKNVTGTEFVWAEGKNVTASP